MAAKLGARSASMTIKNGVVTDLDLVVNVEQLLDVREVVFHVFSVADVADDARVETFCQKLKSSDSEGVARLQTVVFLLKQHFVQPTTLHTVEVQVPHQNRPSDFVIVDFEVLFHYFGALNFCEVAFLACLLVGIALTKDNGHFLSFKQNFFSFEISFDETKNQFFLESGVLLQIDFGCAFH